MIVVMMTTLYQIKIVINIIIKIIEESEVIQESGNIIVVYIFWGPKMGKH